MRAICVDDEQLALGLIVSLCRDMPQLDDVKGFLRGSDALEWLKDHDADVAVIDIDMPDMNGIELAVRLKSLCPHAAVVFLTAYPQYALNALEIHASGYILKPISRARLASEIDYALSAPAKRPTAHVSAHTFGEFDILVDGVPVEFPRSKAKELLAYLIDRQGSTVTRAAVFATLFEDRQYDRSMQKYLDVIIRSLRETLAANGIEDILEMKRGVLRIRPEKLDCDLFHFFEGKTEAINSFHGEYMNAYSWGNLNEAYMEHVKTSVMRQDDDD